MSRNKSIRFKGLMITMGAILFLAACKQTGERNTTTIDSSKMHTLAGDNKALVMQFYQALNDTNWALARSMVHPGYKHYYVKDTGFAALPWEGFEQGYRSSLKAFPDWKLTPINTVADGDYVSVMVKGTGTHLGSFAGIAATKRKATATVILMHQLKDGKLLADWEVMNTEAFIGQLKKK